MKHQCLLLHSFSIIIIIPPVPTFTLAGFSTPDPESNLEDDGKVAHCVKMLRAHEISAMQN